MARQKKATLTHIVGNIAHFSDGTEYSFPLLTIIVKEFNGTTGEPIYRITFHDQRNSMMALLNVKKGEPKDKLVAMIQSFEQKGSDTATLSGVKVPITKKT